MLHNGQLWRWLQEWHWKSWWMRGVGGVEPYSQHCVGSNIPSGIRPESTDTDLDPSTKRKNDFNIIMIYQIKSTCQGTENWKRLINTRAKVRGFINYIAQLDRTETAWLCEILLIVGVTIKHREKHMGWSKSQPFILLFSQGDRSRRIAAFIAIDWAYGQNWRALVHSFSLNLIMVNHSNVHLIHIYF